MLDRQYRRYVGVVMSILDCAIPYWTNLCSKRFRLVSEQKETVERDFRF